MDLASSLSWLPEFLMSSAVYNPNRMPKKKPVFRLKRGFFSEERNDISLIALLHTKYRKMDTLPGN